MVQHTERVAKNVNLNVDVRHDPDGGGVNVVRYLEESTASVAHEGDTTKSGYLTFDLGGMYTIKWIPTVGQV